MKLEIEIYLEIGAWILEFANFLSEQIIKSKQNC